MKSLPLKVGALGAAFLIALPASAAVIGTYSYDYTLGGGGDPQGFAQDATGTQVTDSGGVFRDSFDFGDLSGATIDAFSIALNFSGATPRTATGALLGLDLILLEQWDFRIGGPDADDLSLGVLADDSEAGSVFTFSGTGPTAQAFSDALASLKLGFSFEASGVDPTNQFTLKTAQLTVTGSQAVVPLPAPGLLLLAGLAGLTLVRRKGKDVSPA